HPRMLCVSADTHHPRSTRMERGGEASGAAPRYGRRNAYRLPSNALVYTMPFTTAGESTLLPPAAPDHMGWHTVGVPEQLVTPAESKAYAFGRSLRAIRGKPDQLGELLRGVALAHRQEVDFAGCS